MLIRNIKEFLKLTIDKKLISLDLGKKKIGIAISDSKHIITTPLTVVDKKELFKKLLKIIIEYSLGGILIGIPLNPSKKNSNSEQMVKDMTENINNFLVKNNYELPIFFWDESYTSLEAEELTEKFFKNTKKQKKQIDKFAAKIILDDFLRENKK
tara:strand:+ start:3285 stop:3749 length:465 start_codon:yes stop_codon:yes gene_type:complete